MYYIFILFYFLKKFSFRNKLFKNGFLQNVHLHFNTHSPHCPKKTKPPFPMSLFNKFATPKSKNKMQAFDINTIRRLFPILEQKVYGKPLVYLDNAATTQKPVSVIERESDYYRNENCNIHRGVHHLSQEATEAYEHARRSVASFVNAPKPEEIVFTRGTTESLNLLATCFERSILKKGDKVLVSAMEHHSNLVPWQQAVARTGGSLLVIPMDDNGVLDLDQYAKLLEQQPKVVSVAHVSNTLGTVNPIKEMVAMAHRRGIPVVVDAAQSMAHMKVDVADLDCDFLVFSGHKMYGPMGIGGLYGKTELLEMLPPYQYGGEMVDSVSFERTTFNTLPFKFEAGTPNVGAALGLEAAVEFLNSTDRAAVARHEDEVLDTAVGMLSTIDGIRFIGNPAKRNGLVSFVVEGTHPYDIGTIIDKMGIAVRTGHHCAEPVMARFGVPGTVRASFAMYNTLDEAELFANAVKKAVTMLR